MGRQVEAVEIEVLSHALRLDGLGDDGSATLDSPAKNHLGWRLLVALRNRDDFLLEHGSFCLCGPLHLNVRCAGEAAVCSDCDSLLSAEAEQLGLLKVWMQLNLEASWLDLGVSKDLVDHQGA